MRSTATDTINQDSDSPSRTQIGLIVALASTPTTFQRERPDPHLTRPRATPHQQRNNHLATARTRRFNRNVRTPASPALGPRLTSNATTTWRPPGRDVSTGTSGPQPHPPSGHDSPATQQPPGDRQDATFQRERQ